MSHLFKTIIKVYAKLFEMFNFEKILGKYLQNFAEEKTVLIRPQKGLVN